MTFKSFVFSFMGLGLLMTYTTSQAQTIKPAVGINLTDFSGGSASGTHSARAGFQVGGSVAFGERLYVEPGIFYVAKSTQFDPGNSSQQEVKYAMGGIRIPVAVGYSLINGNEAVLGLRIFGGPSAFILTNTKELNKDDLKTASFGVFAGAGIDIAKLIFVELKYEWSVSDIHKDDVPFDIGRTRSLFLNAGVRIPLN